MYSVISQGRQLFRLGSLDEKSCDVLLTLTKKNAYFKVLLEKDSVTKSRKNNTYLFLFLK